MIHVFVVRKSFDRIAREYGIKFSRDDLETLAGIAAKCYRIGRYEALATALLLLAKKYKIPDDRQMDFITDVTRTVISYLQITKEIDRMLKQGVDQR